MLIIAALCAGSGVFAQQAVTEAAAIKQAYAGIKRNMLGTAEAMPDDQYNFKASPDIRTFGALIAHVADSQARTCAAVAGSTPPESAGSKTTKADLTAALKASYDICDGVINSLNDEDAAKTVNPGGRGPRSKFAVLWGMIAHSNEEYGYLAVYMRLKGIVPPSSAPRQ